MSSYYDEDVQEEDRNWEPCDDCKGTGRCTACKGKGWYYERCRGIDVECEECRGNGDCWNCQGEGWFG